MESSLTLHAWQETWYKWIIVAVKGVLEQVRPFHKKANIPMVSNKRACHKTVDSVNANNKLRKTSQAKTTAKQLEKMEHRLDATFAL